MKTTNPKKKFYWAVYTCINCKTEKSIRVEFGKPMPIFSTKVSKQFGILESPECDYCGCKHWSNGRKEQ